MDLRMGDELALLAATASAFGERVAASRTREDAHDGFDPDVFDKMVSLGWTGLATRDQGERSALGVVVEALARAGVASPLRESTGSCGTLLPFLPGGGDPTLSSALGSGAAVASLLERGGHGAPARWQARGEGAVVDAGPGVLDWGAVADQVVCVAEDRVGRQAVLLVELGAPGTSVFPVSAVDDERPAIVAFEEVPARIIEPPSATLDDALADARALRLALRAAELLGGADAALAMTVTYVKIRHQFGHPIGSFQAVRHACADMATAVEGLRLAVHETLWRASVGLPFRRHAASAVLFAARAADLVGTWASELHGGVGFMADYPLGRFLRRLKAAQVRLGTPADLTAWATPLLLTPTLDRSPFPPSDLALFGRGGAVRQTAL